MKGLLHIKGGDEEAGYVREAGKHRFILKERMVQVQLERGENVGGSRSGNSAKDREKGVEEIGRRKRRWN